MYHDCTFVSLIAPHIYSKLEKDQEDSSMIRTVSNSLPFSQESTLHELSAPPPGKVTEYNTLCTRPLHSQDFTTRLENNNSEYTKANSHPITLEKISP